jgi:sugar lactone lactonase YvrE
MIPLDEGDGGIIPTKRPADNVSLTPIAHGIHLGGIVADGERVWYSDLIDGGVHLAAAETRPQPLLAGQRWLASLLVNEDGRLLVSGPAGIQWVDPATADSGLLLDEVGGTTLPGVNEMCPDGAGGLYFGTVDLPAIERGDRPAPVGIYHLRAVGGARAVADGLVFTNGLAVSADGRTLFHNESFVGTFAYPIDSDGGLGERRLVVEMEDCDGIQLDRDGNLWISGFFSQEVVCVTPHGDTIRAISVPGGGVSNVRFAGADGRSVYATAVAPGASAELRAGRIPVKRDSVLYRAASPVPGRVFERTRLRLQGGSQPMSD